MSEVITILTSGSGNQIAKAFVGPEFVQQRFSIGRSFTAYEEQVSDLMSLSRLLQKLENEPTKTIIRGALVDRQRGPVSRNKATITSPFSIAANGDPESSANHFMPKRCYRTTPVLDRLKLRGA